MTTARKEDGGKKLTIRLAKLIDHTIISIIIAVQFLSSIFFLLSIPWSFNYGGGSAGHLLPWIAFWVAGIVTAVRLQKPQPKRRIAALLWNSVLPGYVIFRGWHVNWQNPFDNFNNIATMCGIFAVIYLAVTTAIGFLLGNATTQA